MVAEPQIRSLLETALPGSRLKGRIQVGTMASGASIDINYVVLKGASEGPCLWVNGQVHGVELNGVLAALDFINEIDPATLSGTVVVTASANPLALDARLKSAPQDDNDLDQNFPGRSDGFITERLAAALFAEAKVCANVLVNMHTNSPAFDGKPYTVYKQHPAGLVSKELLLKFQAAFDPSVSCLMNIAPGQGELLGNISGALDYQLLAIGIPAFMVELGGGSRAEAPYIRQGVVGLKGVATQMGMFAQSGLENQTPAPRVLRHVTRRGHVTFNHGGLFRSERKAGEMVPAGELLGSVMNLHGETIDELTLPIDVIVICIRRDPVVHTGDRFIYVAQSWSEMPLGD